MTLTTLVTHVEPGAGGTAAWLATPLALAEAFQAHLVALVFPAEVEVVSANLPSWDLAAQEEAAATAARDLAARRGVSCEVRARGSFAYGVGEVFADHLRVADLGVLAWRAGAGSGQRMLADAAVFDSGRPVLLVPAEAPPAALPRRVLVAWDATPAAVRALHGALPLIRRSGEALVVTVTDDKQLRPGQSGIEVTHLLARHGVKATFLAAQRGPGGVLETLTATARREGAGLLVMGAMRHSAIRNLVLGSATRDLMESGLGLPTLLAA